MEDKERQFYFEWMTQLMQYNMQLMNNIMQMSTVILQQAFTPSHNPMMSPPILSKDMADAMMKVMTGGEDLAEKFNKAMFGKLDDKDKLT